MKNLFKNKTFIAILVAVLAIGIVIAIAVFASTCSSNKKSENGVKFEIEYLASEYVAGDTAVFKIRAYSDKLPSAIVYTFDNGAEQTLTTKAGKTEGEEKNYAEYFIDTGTETLELTDASVGEHLIKFFMYEGNTRISLGSARIINILSAE